MATSWLLSGLLAGILLNVCVEGFFFKSEEEIDVPGNLKEAYKDIQKSLQKSAFQFAKTEIGRKFMKLGFDTMKNKQDYAKVYNQILKHVEEARDKINEDLVNSAEGKKVMDFLSETWEYVQKEPEKVSKLMEQYKDIWGKYAETLSNHDFGKSLKDTIQYYTSFDAEQLGNIHKENMDKVYNDLVSMFGPLGVQDLWSRATDSLQKDKEWVMDVFKNVQDAIEKKKEEL